MVYTKPELNVIGAAEGLVLGAAPGNRDLSGHTKASSIFEFED
jgi:hypothetical protein